MVGPSSAPTVVAELFDQLVFLESEVAPTLELASEAPWLSKILQISQWPLSASVDKTLFPSLGYSIDHRQT